MSTAFRSPSSETPNAWLPFACGPCRGRVGHLHGDDRVHPVAAAGGGCRDDAAGERGEQCCDARGSGRRADAGGRAAGALGFGASGGLRLRGRHPHRAGHRPGDGRGNRSLRAVAVLQLHHRVAPLVPAWHVRAWRGRDCGADDAGTLDHRIVAAGQQDGRMAEAIGQCPRHGHATAAHGPRARGGGRTADHRGQWRLYVGSQFRAHSRKRGSGVLAAALK